MTRTQETATIVVSAIAFVAAIAFIVVAILEKRKMNKILANMDFNFIKEFETGSTKPTLTVFRNKIDGNLEVGFGHVLPKISTWEVGDKITEQQANEFFENDIQRAYSVYGSRLNWGQFTTNQIRAIISHAYNTGAKSDTIIKFANSGKWQELAKWWREHYITSGGVKLNGLIKRRNYEADLLTK